MHNKIKTTILLFFIITIFFGCKPDKREGYTLYENENYGVSIEYPEDWNSREGFGKESESGTGAIVVFQSPSEGKKDLFRENTYIFTEDLPDTVQNVTQYMEYSKSALPAQMGEFEVLEEGTAKMDGEKSEWIIFSYVQRLQKMQSIAYIFHRGDYGLVIISTSRPESFMSFRRTFENIATSIKFE